MNLAEIRRKAQAAEAQAQAQAQAASPSPVQAEASREAAISIEELWQTLATAPAPAGQPAAARVEPNAAPVLETPAAVPPKAEAAPEAPAAPAWQAPPDWQPARGVLPEEPPVAKPAPVVEEPLDDLGAPEEWQRSETISYPGISYPDMPQQLPPMEQWLEPAPFDPASLILRGRESAAGQEETREVEQAEETLELLCFRVATEDYAISIMDIKEIIKPREVTEVPRVPEFVRGILSLRGIIIPVFDMRLRLGLPSGERSDRERIVVVKRQNGFCGVLVDQVVQVVRIPEASVEAPPVVLEGIDRDFVQGIGRVSGRMLILLDMEKVLDVGLL